MVGLCVMMCEVVMMCELKERMNECVCVMMCGLNVCEWSDDVCVKEVMRVNIMSDVGGKSAKELLMLVYFMVMMYGVVYIIVVMMIIMLNKYMLSVMVFYYFIVLSSLGVVCGWTLSLIGVYVMKMVDIFMYGDIMFMMWVKNVLLIGFF